MSKRIYTEVLRTNFKSLGYFADELTEAKSDFEFFRVLAMYIVPVSYTHLRAHETSLHLVCRLLLEKIS